MALNHLPVFSIRVQGNEAVEITLPHPYVVLVCAAAFGVGYIIRWLLEENGIDIEAQLRRLFGR
jgi:hypothetical protein